MAMTCTHRNAHALGKGCPTQGKVIAYHKIHLNVYPVKDCNAKPGVNRTRTQSWLRQLANGIHKRPLLSDYLQGTQVMSKLRKARRATQTLLLVIITYVTDQQGR